jgi:hypothetical protein
MGKMMKSQEYCSLLILLIPLYAIRSENVISSLKKITPKAQRFKNRPEFWMK